MKIVAVLILLTGVAMGVALPAQTGKTKQAPKVKQKMDETLVVGGGCFWCLEPLFEMLKGVKSVESGYAGGSRANVTYEEVCSGVTGHAEVNKITFDPKVISREDLLRVFLTIHDPTTKDRQGPDSGTQYRSVIFYETPEQKLTAEKVIHEIDKEGIWKDPIVTEVTPLKNYTRAEEYHQDYYKKFESASEVQRMRMNSGYCKVVIEPKVRKYRAKLAHLSK